MSCHRVVFAGVLCALVTLLPARVAAQDGPDAAGPSAEVPVTSVEDRLHHERLDNGLEVLVLEDRSAPVVACRVYVQTGSINEGEYLGCGISHLYEHILSGGTTTTRTEAESGAILDSIGGQSNAYTTYDKTCYHITTASPYYGTALDLLGDWMANNTLDADEVAREREVVQRELEMNDDEPSNVLWRVFQRTMFREHPIRHPVIGHRANIERLTREDIRSYYEARYAPNNAVLSIAGDVDPEEALAAAREAFGSWERKPLPDLVIPSEPRQVSERWVEETHPAAESVQVRVGYHTVDLLHPDLHPLDILSFVLTEGQASRLVRQVVMEEQLAQSISSFSWTPSFGAGQFVFSFEVDEPAKVRPVVDRIETALERVASEGVGPEELARAKRQKISEHVFGNQDMEERAEQVANDLMATGDPLFSERYVTAIQETTAGGVQRVAGEWFDRSNRTVTVLRPEGSEPARGRTATETTAASGEVRREVLDNGVTVLVEEAPGSGEVAIQAYLQGGVRFETDDPEGERPPNGTFSILSRLLTAGTDERTEPEIARTVEGMGADLSGDSGNNTFGLSMTLLAGDLDRGLDVFADCLLDSTFPEDPFSREFQRANFAARTAWSNWQFAGTYRLREAFFGEHPYSMNPYGTPETLAAVDRDLLRDVHDRFVRGDNLVVGVVGDVDDEVALRKVRARFGGLESGFSQEPGGGTIPERDGFEEVTLEGDFEQTVIMLAFPGLPVDHEDRAALALVDGFTSGVSLPSGWLHEALRGGDRSLAYFIHAIPFSGIDAGMFYVMTQCTPGTADEVTQRIRRAMERARRGDFTEEELENARRQNVVSHALGLQASSARAQSMVLNELYGLGADWDRRWIEEIQSVSADEVREVASELLRNGLLLRIEPRGQGGGEG